MSEIGGYVNKLEFNDGTELGLNKNDIVVFVGPNNVGKSQTLRDVYMLCQRNNGDTTVVKRTVIHKEDAPTKDFLDSLAPPQLIGDDIYRYQTLGHYITHYGNQANNWSSGLAYGDYCPLFVANLDTEARLSICKPVQNIPRSNSRQHPIHYVAFDEEKRKWLSSMFEKAFGVSIFPNACFGSEIPLCIGEELKIGSENIGKDFTSCIEDYAKKLEKYDQVQSQGDGMKSFTSILLYLMLDHYRTFLIDEPESFLHPPQAKIMGQIIGEALTDNQQALISTHSEEIIKGLLDKCPNRVKIVRITRDGNRNKFAVLNNEVVQEIMSDPLLKHSNIIAGLFYKTTVLCESDSDCKFYAVIDEYLKEQKGRYSEAFFIHCGGKHRAAKIIKALKTLGIDLRIILDIDVLNNEGIFKNMTNALGMDWNNIKKDFHILESQLSNSGKEKIRRSTAREDIIKCLDASQDDYLTEAECKTIKSIVQTHSAWDSVKKAGLSAIPSGEATNAFKRINEKLRAKGLYMVPAGELEGFVREVSSHGPEWVNGVLEKYPDFSDNVYEEVRGFIKSLAL